MTLTEINMLVGQAEWAWREAVEKLFVPRGINSLMAQNATDALDILGSRTVHTAIVDIDARHRSGLSIVRIIRGYYPKLPCIMVSNVSGRKLLSSALELNVFSVIAKPVDMAILQEQLNRLFIKKYNSMIFS